MYKNFIETIFHKFHCDFVAGACHADELFYLFDIPHLYESDFSDSDRQFNDQFLHVWATFLHEGQPPKLSDGQSWPQSGFGRMQFVSMSEQGLQAKHQPFVDRCEQFWRQLVEAYRI
jgi:carboxylesterase type B